MSLYTKEVAVSLSIIKAKEAIIRFRKGKGQMDNYLLQIIKIIPYWLSGILLGAILNTYYHGSLDRILCRITSLKSTLLLVAVSSILGAVSPITLFGVIPLIYSFDLSTNKKLEAAVVAFITTSMLISPNVFVFTLSLGLDIALIRLIGTIAIGVIMGLITDIMLVSRTAFIDLNNSQWQKEKSMCIEDKNKISTLAKNFYFAFRKTGRNLFIGIVLSYLIVFFVPASFYDRTFISNAVAVPVSAVLSTFLYQCGGGSIPIIHGLMREGLTTGAAITFMMVGPLTKITNLGALGSIMPLKRLAIYISIMSVYMLTLGWLLG